MKEKLKLVLKFTLATLAGVLLNARFDAPISLALYAALAFSDRSIVAATASFMLSFALKPELSALLSACCMAAVIGGIACVYQKRSKKAGAEVALYIFCASAFYIAAGEGKIYAKLIYTAIIAVFSIVCQEAVNTLESGEYADELSVPKGFCLSTFIAACAVGLVAITGVELYKGVAAFFILLATRLRGRAYAFAGVLSIPLAVDDPKYSAIFFCYAALSSALMPLSPIIAALSPAVADFALYSFLSFYDSFGYLQGIALLCGGVCFALIPPSVYDGALTLSPKNLEVLLTKDAINRTRSELSAKTYDLAGVFSGLQSALASLADKEKESFSATRLAALAASSCASCSLCARCARIGYPDIDELEKIAEVGIAKGRITLVDMTKSFLDVCGYPNGMIFEINKLIASHSEKTRADERAREVNEILRLFSKGVADSLKDEAFSLSSPATLDATEEKKLAKKIRLLGGEIKGLLVTGTGKEKRVSVYAKKNVDGVKLALILSQATDERLSLSSVTQVDAESSIFLFSPSPELDAVFGVSSVTKYSSEACGDSHSLIKLDEKRFLVALSDGMGSGKKAFATTDAALSLVEGLYRAGVASETALPLVNKILSVATEDNFSAVDLAVVDLALGSCDFIKIGAPYGFIVSAAGLRFVEGSSLPLGILDELKPTVATSTVSDGDMLLMLSDGVTDAFSSSSEFVDFLKTAPSSNPQALCDSVIKRALELDGGAAEDDMTALCVRIFKSA